MTTGLDAGLCALYALYALSTSAYSALVSIYEKPTGALFSREKGAHLYAFHGGLGDRVVQVVYFQSRGIEPARI